MVLFVRSFLHRIAVKKWSLPQLRKYSPQIAIVFLFIFAGCTSFNTTDQEDLDYKILLEEQIEVQFNAASNTRFQQILEDYKAFKKQLYSAIRDRYNDQFREDEFYQIQKLLLGVRSERRNRLDGTVDVFDPTNLIWVACFGTDSENPSYSFFFEKVSTIDGINHYKIKGVGFNWNRKLKKIDNINWREGHYIPVKSSESTYYNYMFSR